MALPEKQFDELVNDQVAAIQASAGQVLDFSVGSILLAIVESNAGNTLWIEGLVTKLLAITRLTTSKGEDVDTFLAQFGLERLGAVNSTGEVTFSRFTPSVQAVIPAGTLDTITQGALVYSPASQVTYSVYADASNPNYDPDLNAYVIPIDTSNATVPIVALTAGAIGNVLVNQITTISSVIIGVDTVTNDQPLTNGQDQESDDAAKIRFVLYINSLSKATKQALEAVIAGTEGVKRYKLVENEDVIGNTLYGFFYAVIDDGTGNASDTLLQNVQIALYATRGFTIGFSVYAPTPFPIGITATVTANGTIPADTVKANILSALQQYIISLGFDALIPYSRIPWVIYNADPTVTDITSYTLNGSTIDITLSGRQIATVGTLSVNVDV